jgi:pimeloyl-ACP methyl ester carboxylesterase
MARTQIDGIGIDYQLIGDGPLTIITPGGRFSKDAGGIRELAEMLAAGGRCVLVWDRPNCGASDLCFTGASEAVLNADTLAGLVRHVDRGPALLIGGSSGARVSILAASRHPEIISHLFLLWISGGPISLAALGARYSAAAAMAAASGGMAAVAELPEWQEQLSRNPGNRARMLAQDPKAFIDTMQNWCAAFFPIPGSPVPGMTAADLTRLGTKPVMILRSGSTDLYHTRETGEALHRMIPGSHIAEPPWGENEWPDRMAAAAKGESLFAHWPMLAPQILAFAKA